MRSNSFLAREFIEDITEQLQEIKVSSRETKTINKVQVLMEYVKNYYEKVDNDRETLIRSIEDSMKQARHNNSEMEPILYIIHGDLINSRISIEKAGELYEQYLNVELFDRKIL